jgi:hypothetical protein
MLRPRLSPFLSTGSRVLSDKWLISLGHHGVAANLSEVNSVSHVFSRICRVIPSFYHPFFSPALPYDMVLLTALLSTTWFSARAIEIPPLLANLLSFHELHGFAGTFADFLLADPDVHPSPISLEPVPWYPTLAPRAASLLFPDYCLPDAVHCSSGLRRPVKQVRGHFRPPAGAGLIV